MKGNEEHTRPVRHQRPERSGHGLNERLAAISSNGCGARARNLSSRMPSKPAFCGRDHVETDGPSLSIYRHGPKATGGMSPVSAVAILSRYRRRLSSESPRPILGSSGRSLESAFETFEEATRHDDRTELCELTSSKQDRADELVLVRAIRAAAERPNASDVASLLLIAQAVPNNATGLDDVLQAPGLSGRSWLSCARPKDSSGASSIC